VVEYLRHAREGSEYPGSEIYARWLIACEKIHPPWLKSRHLLPEPE
jgi:hypothetical protein